MLKWNRLLITFSLCAPVVACGDLPTSVLRDEVARRANAGPGGTSAVNLFAGATLYVNPNARPAVQAQQWRASRPADAAWMDKLAAVPEVIWWGDWNADVRADVARMTGQIVAAGALPVYVAYNIPLRDCGLYSSGGASSAAAYRAWIRALAAGLGDTRAVVVLEPDAVAGIDCLTAAQQAERYSLLADAVGVLQQQGSAVYIDAGNALWHPAAEIAARLQRAGIAQATGFALNVSNFLATAPSAAYGASVSALVGGKRFVIDTSRNGLGPAPDGDWCNPPGRAVGDQPTTRASYPGVDALLWIKKPGESDGTCNGGPRAGEWWPEYALGLVQRAG